MMTPEAYQRWETNHRKAMSKSYAMTNEERQARLALILSLRDEGMTLRGIGARVGLSADRVHQLICRAKR